MSGSAFTVPEKVSFESAIALTQSLLSQMQAGELSEAEIETAIAELVKTENGTRGFFVTYLTSEGTIADNPSAAVIRALQANPDTVSELLVKNVAMSAVMAVAHHRNGNEEMAQSSQRVRSRTTRIIEQVELPSVYEVSQKLLESAVTGEGSYKAFLERRGYDSEQRQVLSEALEQLIKRNG
ncbi:hypothetical protein [Coleofasciculus sp. FACHB-SPT36]|uniref:hypothetical protein n=1 Tax=Cyanophyceae TaxID=3028117 RepID=UPI00168B8822|nr:hypothetical protein [Coleofasciculus sp. FACHB-SPT36]MBD2539460.1 hypothetical protein [Coleofasciculus sp. FACHB-SPT36]